jgi:2-C-methyl-D-erythritol 2,4-cyclodiphosphate synthase
LRIGHGYDAHRLIEGRRLVLGGVEIPYEKGLLGHSDADVLVHAIMDALLGAAAIGDIGKLFPDSDVNYKDANSIKLLEKVHQRLEANGYSIVNIDCTVIAQSPKLAPFMEQMRWNIASALQADIGCINIKATTEEGMGFTGIKDGMSAHAVCLIE